MAGPVLYDAVTLRHFAAVRRLDLLRLCHEAHDEPRWAEAVKHEISDARLAGHGECAEILTFSWLGEPLEPQAEDQRAINFLRIALGDAGTTASGDGLHRNLGEAESIHLAQKHAYQFVTDDNEAHLIATRRLGMGRVFDTVDVLRKLVAMGEVNAAEACAIAAAIRSSGRDLRRSHPDPLRPSDF